MSVRTLAATIAVSTALCAPAGAQAPVRPEQRAMNVSVQTSMTFPGSTATKEDETELQGRARAAFYAIAANECAAITAALNVDCRPTQLTVNSRTVEVRPGSATQAPGVLVSGTMTFSVTPR